MLEVKDLCYQIRGKEIVKHASLTVKDGEFVGIIGPNGSGKSTLLKNIYKVLKPTSGQIMLDGKDLLAMSNREMASHLAVVAQENGANFDFTVEEVVEMGCYSRRKLFESNGGKERALVYQMLQKTGMEELAERSFLSLSGGEKQRVLIARAFAQETPMIILDEPTNHLDAGSQMRTLKLLKESGKTVLTALHDLSLAARFCDRIYVMYQGSDSVSGTPEEVISSELIRKLYDLDGKVFHYDGRLYIDYE